MGVGEVVPVVFRAAADGIAFRDFLFFHCIGNGLAVPVFLRQIREEILPVSFSGNLHGHVFGLLGDFPGLFIFPLNCFCFRHTVCQQPDRQLLRADTVAVVIVVPDFAAEYADLPGYFQDVCGFIPIDLLLINTAVKTVGENLFRDFGTGDRVFILVFPFFTFSAFSVLASVPFPAFLPLVQFNRPLVAALKVFLLQGNLPVFLCSVLAGHLYPERNGVRTVLLFIVHPDFPDISRFRPVYIDADLDIDHIGNLFPVVQADGCARRCDFLEQVVQFTRHKFQRFPRQFPGNGGIVEVEQVADLADVHQVSVCFARYADIIAERSIGNRKVNMEEILDDLPDNLAAQFRALVLHRNTEHVFGRDKVGCPVVVLAYLGDRDRQHFVSDIENVDIYAQRQFADQCNRIHPAADQAAGEERVVEQVEYRQLDIQITAHVNAHAPGLFRDVRIHLEQQDQVYVVRFVLIVRVAQHDPALDHVNFRDRLVPDAVGAALSFFALLRIVGNPVARFVGVHLLARQGCILLNLEGNDVCFRFLILVVVPVAVSAVFAFLLRLVLVVLVIDDTLLRGIELHLLNQFLIDFVLLRVQLFRQLVKAFVRRFLQRLRQIVKQFFRVGFDIAHPLVEPVFHLAGVFFDFVLEGFQDAVFFLQLADTVDDILGLTLRAFLLLLQRQVYGCLPGIQPFPVILRQFDKLDGFPFFVVAVPGFFLDQYFYALGMVLSLQIDIPLFLDGYLTVSVQPVGDIAVPIPRRIVKDRVGVFNGVIFGRLFLHGIPDLFLFPVHGFIPGQIRKEVFPSALFGCFHRFDRLVHCRTVSLHRPRRRPAVRQQLHCDAFGAFLCFVVVVVPDFLSGNPDRGDLFFAPGIDDLIVNHFTQVMVPVCESIRVFLADLVFLCSVNARQGFAPVRPPLEIRSAQRKRRTGNLLPDTLGVLLRLPDMDGQGFGPVRFLIVFPALDHGQVRRLRLRVRSRIRHIARINLHVDDIRRQFPFGQQGVVHPELLQILIRDFPAGFGQLLQRSRIQFRPAPGAECPVRLARDADIIAGGLIGNRKIVSGRLPDHLADDFAVQFRADKLQRNTAAVFSRCEMRGPAVLLIDFRNGQAEPVRIAEHVRADAEGQPAGQVFRTHAAGYQVDHRQLCILLRAGLRFRQQRHPGRFRRFFVLVQQEPALDHVHFRHGGIGDGIGVTVRSVGNVIPRIMRFHPSAGYNGLIFRHAERDISRIVRVRVVRVSRRVYDGSVHRQFTHAVRRIRFFRSRHTDDRLPAVLRCQPADRDSFPPFRVAARNLFLNRDFHAFRPVPAFLVDLPFLFNGDDFLNPVGKADIPAAGQLFHYLVKGVLGVDGGILVKQVEISPQFTAVVLFYHQEKSPDRRIIVVPRIPAVLFLQQVEEGALAVEQELKPRFAFTPDLHGIRLQFRGAEIRIGKSAEEGHPERKGIIRSRVPVPDPLEHVHIRERQSVFHVAGPGQRLLVKDRRIIGSRIAVRMFFLDVIGNLLPVFIIPGQVFRRPGPCPVLIYIGAFSHSRQFVITVQNIDFHSVRPERRAGRPGFRLPPLGAAHRHQFFRRFSRNPGVGQHIRDDCIFPCAERGQGADVSAGVRLLSFFQQEFRRIHCLPDRILVQAAFRIQPHHGLPFQAVCVQGGALFQFAEIIVKEASVRCDLFPDRLTVAQQFNGNGIGNDGVGFRKLPEIPVFPDVPDVILKLEHVDNGKGIDPPSVFKGQFRPAVHRNKPAVPHAVQEGPGYAGFRNAVPVRIHRLVRVCKRDIRQNPHISVIRSQFCDIFLIRGTERDLRVHRQLIAFAVFLLNKLQVKRIPQLPDPDIRRRVPDPGVDQVIAADFAGIFIRQPGGKLLPDLIPAVRREILAGQRPGPHMKRVCIPRPGNGYAAGFFAGIRINDDDINGFGNLRVPQGGFRPVFHTADGKAFLFLCVDNAGR